MHLRILLLSALLVSCEQATNDTEVCYMCSDRTPYAISCETQIGQLTQESEPYYCNLYFGDTHLCQTQVTCCDAVGGIVDDTGTCLVQALDADPESLRDTVDQGQRRLEDI